MAIPGKMFPESSVSKDMLHFQAKIHVSFKQNVPHLKTTLFNFPLTKTRSVGCFFKLLGCFFHFIDFKDIKDNVVTHLIFLF